MTEPWRELDEETLPPLERILPEEVYQALQGEIRRQREDVPSASGLGLEHLNTIPANYPDALKKAKILMDRTLRWRQLCFLYEIAERQIRPVVIFRKLSFGNRTEIGAHRHAVLISVVETLHLQQRNIPSFLLRTRLAEPHDFATLASELVNSS